MLVVAKYTEDISWTEKYENVKVYDKGPGGNTPNIGRESHTYLMYIVDNYEILPETVYFSQGRIDDHGFTESQFTDPKYTFAKIENGTENGRVSTYRGCDVTPNSENMDVKKWFSKYIDSEIDLEQPIKIFYNGIFSVKRYKILSRPKQYYQMLLDLIPHEINPEIAYFLERAWYYIFNMHKNNHQVYCVYHDSELSKKVTDVILNVYEWMIPYKLNSTKYFENEIILNMQIDMTKKYVGQITYNFAYSKYDIFTHIDLNKLLDSVNTDIVTLYHNPHEKIRDIHKSINPKFIDIWTRLLIKMLPNDIDVLSDSIKLFYCNFWVAKPEIMKEYQDFLKKAIELLEEDPDVYDDAGYTSPTVITKERLVEISGKPYYTFHPFILERLPCVFFWYKGYSMHHANIIN